MRRKGGTLAILVAGGGFYGELRGLLPRLSPEWSRLMLIPDTGWGLAEAFPHDDCVKVPAMIRSRAAGARTSPLYLLKVVGRYLAVFLRRRPEMAIAVGTIDAAPLALAARLAGVPLVFIESITRVSDLSTTGKWIYRLRMARRFYVQWPGLTESYPRALYRGIVHDLRDRRNDPL